MGKRRHKETIDPEVFRYITDTLGHYNTNIGYLQIPLREIKDLYLQRDVKKGAHYGRRDAKT